MAEGGSGLGSGGTWPFAPSGARTKRMWIGRDFMPPFL
jgi:hypothetical protein